MFTLILTGLAFFSCAHKNKTYITPPREITDFSGTHQTVTMQSSDNLKLFSQYWAPARDVKAVILLLHGTALHSGVYEDSGKYLSENGYVVYATDFQGWGQSEGKGQRGYIDSYDTYVADLKLIMSSIKSTWPDKKCFVLAESFGALVPVYGALKEELTFDGYILSAVAYRPNPKILGIRPPEFVATLEKKASSVAGKITPKLPIVPANIGITLAVIDKDTQKKLLEDPYVTRSILPAMYVESLFKAAKYVDQEIQRFDSPVLLLHGTKDVIMPVSSSRSFFMKISSTDREMKIYESGHATLVEPARYEVLEDVKTWLDAHIQ